MPFSFSIPSNISGHPVIKYYFRALMSAPGGSRVNARSRYITFLYILLFQLHLVSWNV